MAVDTTAAWRPPQWSAKTSAVAVTVPAGYSAPQPSSATDPATNNYTLTTAPTAAQTYVFDAVLSIEHEQTLTKTMHPVQSSVAITSHAYLDPARLVLYVLMSDVVGQYVAANQTQAPYIQQFIGYNSKSVSAYQQMLTLQAARVPLTVTTRLRTYNNMLISSITPTEDSRTTTGARFRLMFEQIFIASTQQTSAASTRPNDTGSTSLGSVNTTTVPTTVDNQFGVHAYDSTIGTDTTGTGDVALPPDLHNGSTPVIDNGVPGYLSSTPGGPATFTPQYPNSVSQVDVPGAGDYSSVNYNTVQQSQ